MGARRAHGEEGVSLILALAFLVLFGLTVPPLLNLGTANLLSTSRLHDQRATVYAADGATDAAIQYLRSHPGCGRQLQVAASCPILTDSSHSSFSATVGGQAATTTITGTGALFALDRSVTLSTTVGGSPRVDAKAIIRDSSPLEPPVDVVSWKYSR